MPRLSRLPVLLAAVLAAVLVLDVAPALAEDPPPARPLPPGPVCGDGALVGRSLPPIDGEGDCGVAAPVLLASVAGVALQPPATVGCGAAQALAAWVEAVRPVFPAGLVAMTVVDAYSCRNRNREKDGKLSEHALGNAIDIAAFRRGDGSTLAVGAGWKGADDGPLLRSLHAAACGPFGTVLGPEANALHADHLHLDVEARRSGPYCE